jgi:hypothetical protein
MGIPTDLSRDQIGLFGGGVHKKVRYAKIRNAGARGQSRLKPDELLDSFIKFYKIRQIYDK